MSELATQPICHRCDECRNYGLPRGSWSPYFCEGCDITRMKRLDASMCRIAGGTPKPDGWHEAKSVEIRAREGWPR